MKYTFLNWKEIHDLVEKSEDAFWDGYTAIFVNRNRDGFLNPRGIFHDGDWVTAFRSDVNRFGKWKVPMAYVESIK